ncbi:unnamed protein product [Dovyalis caffra]|uniref:Leucine-rich repeat protein n=1 Tax=Dovyalis caffra TaxID=77055 RepID=A0AAV1QQU6_9ROSI|nr:unnamed protein product [Dovyalis caffra]
MGCCASRNADSKAARVARWRSTGITFPDDVLDLDKAVRTLDLTHNKLVDIPMEISKLINLQRLVLADNLIERLPMNLGKLQSLKVMTLDGNRIASLPDELGQLVRLERLSISGNFLTCLPETIGSLRNVSDSIWLSKLNLAMECFEIALHLLNNLIEDLPASVCNLIHLKSLSLNNNSVGQPLPVILTNFLNAFHFGIIGVILGVLILFYNVFSVIEMPTSIDGVANWVSIHNSG